MKRRRSGPPSLAKLTAPTLPVVVSRPRLFRLLDRACKQKIAWIVGPPGSGKTTLVASYLQARKLKPFWYQVDEGDNDPATLIHYLSLAAQRAAPRYRTPLPHLTPEYLPGLPIFARRFFEQLYQRVSARTTLVFDNYHTIATASSTHELLLAAIETLPTSTSLIILSRTDPPAAVARWQAEQRIAMIDESALRMTEEEAWRLVRMPRHGRASMVTRQASKQLHDKTNGWVAGLVLLSKESLKSQAPGIMKTQDSPTVLFDYLANEILGKMDQDQRRTLLTTAIAPWVTGAMAKQLSGVSTAEDILDRLYKTCYFTERRADGEPRYQYHPLFQDFLRAHAAKELSAEELMRLRTTAGRLMEQAGFFEEAVELYREAGQVADVIRIILTQAQAFLGQGRFAVIDQWIGQLPSSVVEQTPWLLFWQGTARLIVNPLYAQRLYERAFEQFQVQGDRAGILLAWCGVVDAICYAWKDLPQLDRWIDRFAALMPEGERYPSPEVEAAVASAMFNALFWRRPNATTMAPWAAKIERTLKQAPVLTFQVATSGVSLVNHHFYCGRMAKAEQTLGLVDEALRRSLSAPAAELAREQTEAVISTVTGDADRAAQAVVRGLDRAKQSGVFLWNVPLYGAGCIGALLLGDLRQARRYVDLMLAQSRQGALFFHSWAMTLQCWIAFEQGDLLLAQQAAESSLELTLREGPIPEAMSRLCMAQVLHTKGQRAEAVRHLARLEEIAREAESPLIELGYRLTAAQFAFDRDDGGTGLGELRAGMAIGAAAGLIDWQGKMRTQDLARLCARALEEGIEPAYVRTVIHKRHLVPDGATADLEAWPWPIKVYTLGRFALVRDGNAVSFTGKTQKRPLDLLKALIAFGGRDVSEAKLLEALWPEADGDAATASFSMALKRLRELLGHAEAVTLTERKLTVNPKLCWIDAWAFERGLSDQKNTAQVRRAVALYRGPFLGTEEAEWSLSARERLRAKFLSAVGLLGRACEARQQWAEAIALCQQGLQADDLAEEFYQRLMVCHDRLGQRGEALTTYRRCKKTLATHLGVVPSEQTEAILASVLR